MNFEYLWLILVLASVTIDALIVFIDNYVSDVYFKGNCAVAQRVFYAFTTTAFGVIVTLIGGLENFTRAEPSTFFFLFLAGVISTISHIPYLKALEIDDSTNIGIFFQLAPILYLVIGWLFLGDSLTPVQLAAFFLVLSAPILIIATTRKRSRKAKLKASLLTSLYVVLAVIANLIFVEHNLPGLNFLTCIGLFLLGKGIGNSVILIFRPKWRRRFRAVLKSSNKKVLRPLAIDAVLGIMKDIAGRAGLVLAPSVALASAISDSSEPMIIFFLGLALTLIWPKFGREELNKKSVLIHLVAIVIVVAGIILLQFQA